MRNDRHHLFINPENITPEERLDALADVLAEGFLYLAENGLLESLDGDSPKDAGRMNEPKEAQAKAIRT